MPGGSSSRLNEQPNEPTKKWHKMIRHAVLKAGGERPFGVDPRTIQELGGWAAHRTFPDAIHDTDAATSDGVW